MKRKASFFLAVLISILTFPIATLAFENNKLQSFAMVKGRVVDAKTGKPLPSVNVFLAQTTIGDATDNDGRFSIPDIPPGDYQLIVSMIGYEMQKIRIRLAASDRKQFIFKLKPKILQGEEVTVFAKYPKNWKRNLEIFEKTFFGLTDFAKECKLLNPEVLDFKYDKRTGLFEARAEQPIRFVNEALGYEVSFILEHYVLELVKKSLYTVVTEDNLVVLQNAGYKCKGILKFKDLMAQDEKKAQKWKKNRRMAYRGSFQHFLRSLWTGRLKQEGFEIFGSKFPRAKYEYKIKPQDILYATPQPGQKMLSFPDYLEVVYKKEKDKICERMQMQLLNKLKISEDTRQSLYIEQVYRQCANQVSWIRIMNAGNVIINKQGQILSSDAELEFAGYWKWNTLGESLPIDYAWSKK